MGQLARCQGANMQMSKSKVTRRVCNAIVIFKNFFYENYLKEGQK